MYFRGSPGATLPDTAYWIISIKGDSAQLNTGQASVMIWLVPKALQREEIAGHKWVSDGIEIRLARVECTPPIPGIQGEREEEETCNHKSHHVPLRYGVA